MDDLPHFLVVDQIIAVNKYIPKRDNLRGTGNLYSDSRIDTRESIYGFTNDFEISFHRLAQLTITLEIFQCFVSRNIKDK